MSMDKILAIKDSETQAEEIILKANDEARRILAETKHQTIIMVEKEIENAEKQASKRLKDAEIEANSFVEKLRITHEKENQLLIESSSKNIDKAVNVILERIVTAHGSC